MLNDKVALITGAGQGIGQGIALALAKRGVKIVAAGRTLAKCEQTCRLIAERHGTDALALSCDVTMEADLERAVTATVERFGGIHILVNNAVSTVPGPLLAQKHEQVLNAFMVGPIATLRLMQLCHPYLSREGGSIVNLASTAAKRWDMSNYGVYAAEKEAIRALTRAAASEWGAANIRANCILPHARSPALEKWMERHPEEAAEFVRGIPLQRVGDCEADIGEFVAVLCGPESSYISGQSIAVDGGQAYMG
ncbi:MAG: SDR family oxidoreductase [Gammaproteobacteria bacterium]|nr:SDR family oxidoreductase [Gammaproteobacteria bacterium]